MINIVNITKEYAGVPAVSNLSLKIKEGELCVLIGPSGCGKSTLLRMINRLVVPTAGNIFVNGKDVGLSRPETLRRGMGYVIQNIGLFPHLSVFDNIATVPRLLGWSRAEIARRVDYLLALMGLSSSYKYKSPAQLSGGEAQRIGVARALGADPPILLMDEPFGAVDPLSRARLQNEFYKIHRQLQKTVLFVTHDVEEAIRLGGKIALMKSGRLIQYGTPEDLALHPSDNFVATFLGSEYCLRLLSRHLVENYCTPLPGRGAEMAGLQKISLGSTLKEALSMMISSGTAELAVEGGGPGVLRLDSIIKIFKGEAR